MLFVFLLLLMLVNKDYQNYNNLGLLVWDNEIKIIIFFLAEHSPLLGRTYY